MTRTRKTTKNANVAMIIFAAATAAAVSVVACDEPKTDTAASDTARADNSGAASPKSESPDMNPPNAADPNANIVVTNTNAKVPVNPLAAGANADQVREYPDETKFAAPRTARLITGFATEVRQAPHGESLTVLQTAETVNEIARDATGDYYLVVYPDPSDATKKLAGWVYKDALENYDWSTVDTSSPGGAPLSNTMAPKLGCARGEAHLRTDRDFCGKTCKDDSSCDKKTSERCDGLAFQVNEKANKISNANYCVAGTAAGGKTSISAPADAKTPGPPSTPSPAPSPIKMPAPTTP